MRRFLKTAAGFAAVLILVVGCQMVRNSGDDVLGQPSADGLRIATYNVHYINLRQESGAWSRGDWERRKRPMDLAFKAVSADVIAFQEMESFAGGEGNTQNLTLDWLLDNNPDYDAAAVGDPATFPSTQPILFNRSRLGLVEQGWFFFSTTPDVIYSRTFNGSYPAFASWAMFQNKQGQAFRVVNIHTDFRSRTNRVKSVELVAARIRPWIAAGERVFVVGDLNARLGSGILGVLEAEGIDFAPIDGATYHFDRGLNLFGAIDHIGAAGPVRRSRAPVVLRRQFENEWPTDHYPVVVEYALTQR